MMSKKRITIVVSKRSHGILFDSISGEMKRRPSTYVILWHPKLLFVYRLILHLLTKFIDLNIINLMPAYGLTHPQAYVKTICWDLGHITEPWCKSVGQDLVLRNEMCLKNSDVIIHNTEFMIGEHSRLATYLGEKKVALIPLNLSKAFFDFSSSKCDNFDILSVGTSQDRKNWSMFFDVLINANRPLKVCLVVDNQFSLKYKNSIDSVRDHGHSLFLVTGISRDDLNNLYNNSKNYVQTSLYEGFCVPICEALVSGCRVYILNTPLFDELYAPYCYLFDTAADCVSAIEMDKAPKPDKNEIEKQFLNIDDYCSKLLSA